MAEKKEKKVYQKHDIVPERFKNKGPTPREREEERKIQELLPIAQYIREQELAVEYGKSLGRFVKAAWPLMSPTPFKKNWHHTCIVEHIEALMNRDIRRLIISIPPRSAKSTIISIALPAWRWINHPEEQFLCASYSRSLAAEFSRKTRQLIRSNWYQARWKNSFSLSNDQDEKAKFENNKGGARLAFSVEGGITGVGGSCLHGDSLVATEFGDIPIREIVEKRMPVRVLGSSGEWRRVTAWSKTKTHGPAINIGDESHSLICTDEHPIYIENANYILASDVLASKHGHEIQGTSGDICLRTLRRDFREKQSACRQSQAPLLFKRLPREGLFRATESRMEGRIDRESLHSVRGGVQDKNRPELSDLFSFLCGDPSLGGQGSAPAKNLPILLRGISAATREEDVLLSPLCEFSASGEDSRRGERKIQSGVMAKSVRPWIFRNPAPDDKGPRRQEVHPLSPFGHPPCSPYRRVEGESRPGESRDTLHILSSDGAYEVGYQERMDEPIRLDYARRCEAPDYVYNISVETDEDYYANGILVHNCAIYDDPNDINEMGSAVYRQSVKDWYSGSASSRFINPATDVRLCVQQRAPYGDDLTSYLLEMGGWEHLVIKMEYTGRSAVSFCNHDPRTIMGELLHPDFFPPHEIDILKREQKAGWAGQFQQEPIGVTDGALKQDWFRFYNPPGVHHVNEKNEIIPVILKMPNGNDVSISPVQLPQAFEQVCQSWDLAFKNAEHNDFVAGHVWGRLGANTYLLHRDHGHYSFTETMAAIQKMSVLYPCPEKLVEDKANGPAIMDALQNQIPGLIPCEPYGSKFSRVTAIAGYVEAGNVYLPNPDLYPWVWDLLREFSSGSSNKHDDDTDAMSQALKRLYDTAANSGLPEFRVQSRLGEPQTACHISDQGVPSQWRRMVAVIPGQAAVWLAETPTGSIRILRELSLDRLDATKAGLEIARLSMPDCLARMGQIREVKKQMYELFLPREAFAALESGSYAEILEQAMLSYESGSSDWEEREREAAALRNAHFRCEIIEEEDAALDRLRGLLAFQPPDFKAVDYDRRTALALADKDINAYSVYMNATEGVVTGEWPKLKISPACKELISELGTFRRDKVGEAPPFVKALLLGVCAPRHGKPAEVVERPWPAQQVAGGRRNAALFARKFGTRGR